MISFAPTFEVSNSGSLEKMDIQREWDDDPRGLVFMIEPPLKSATYKMGVDPTLGRTGWNRYSRVSEDKKTNNGAIEIFRAGREFTLPDGTQSRTPDVQVCEYAAPIDPFELAFVANILGRIYAGADDDQCECIIETYPGPGGMTMRQMTDLGYVNLWKWSYYADLVPGQSKSVGWNASAKSLRDLWVKTSRHLVLDRVRITSPYLVEEYADARLNDVKGYVESLDNENGHGDRMRAANLAMWAANKWDMEIERTQEVVSTMRNFDPQSSDMTMEEIQDHWEESFGRMGGW